MRINRFFTVAFALCLLPSMSGAANRFVRAGAAGSGSGSDWTNACSDFTGSCATPVRGDTYYVADGAYAGRSFSTPASGTTRITIKKATASDHGTETGWTSAYGDGLATFTGRISFGSSYWTLDGVTGGGPSSWKTGFGFYVNNTAAPPSAGPGIAINTGVSFVTVRHTEIQGHGDDGACDGCSLADDGVYMGEGSGHLMEYLYVHHQGRVPFFIRSDDTTIRYTWVEHNESTSAEHSEGISAWKGSGADVRNLVIAYTVWKDIEGTGTLICDCDGWDVYGNVFWGIGDAGSGHGAVSSWTDSDVHNARIHNNTFISANKGLMFGGLTGGTRSNITAYNNLFYNTSADFSGVNAHNYSWCGPGSGSACTSEANDQVATADPFVNLAGGDFRLAAATAAGSPLAAPFNFDPTGKTRGADGTWDRGAFEFGSSSTGGSCSVMTPTGSGDRSGSDWNNACAGFTGNCSPSTGMQRGRTYFLGKGAYSAPALSRANSGTLRITIKSPTADDHCTDTGFASASHVGQADMAGRLFVQSDYWTLDGQYGNETPVTGKGTYGMRVRWSGGTQQMQIECSGGCSNTTFRYMELAGSGGADTGCDVGLRVLGYNQSPNTNNFLAEHLYIYRSNNNVGFQFTNYATLANSILSENWSTASCHGENIALNGPTSLTIRHNRLINCAGTACIATPSSLSASISDLNIHGNVFYDDLTRTGSCPGNFTCVGNGILAIIDRVNVTNIRVYNNTVANWIAGHMAGGSSLTFFSASSGGTISGMDMRNNLFYNNVPITMGNSGTCGSNTFIATTRASAACSGDQTGGTGNPFMNPTLDFRLSAANTLIGSGATLSAPYNVDPDGKIRGSDGSWDRGAYEFAGTGTPPPTTPASPRNLRFQ